MTMSSTTASPAKPTDRSANGYGIFAEALPEALARDDFTNLAVLLRYAREGCWAFAIYSHVAAREEVVAALKTLLQPLPTYEWTYSPERPSPLSYLETLTETQRHERAVVFFFDLERAPDELWKSLDYNRELLSAQPHGLVFWISNAGRGRAMRAAPHFWSQRSGIFDFRLAPGPLPPFSDWAQRSDIVIDGWENILRQIRITQGLLDELLATPDAPPTVIAAQHLRLGMLCYYVDRLPAARTQLESAESLASAVEDPHFSADVQKALGDLALREADLAGARRRYEAALALYPQLGDRLGEANVLQSIGNLQRAEGDLEGSLYSYQRALEIHAAIGNRLGVGASLTYMARTFVRQNRQAAAVLALDEALSIDRSIHDQHGEMLDLSDQGNALWVLQAQQAALGAWWQARQIAHAIGASQAHTLDELFAQFSQQLDAAAWTQLQRDLAANAEVWRRQAVAALRLQMEQAAS